MKIKYEFADETVEIEVSDEWGTILVDLDRLEYNNNQAQTRRHCSLDALNLDDNLLPSEIDTETLAFQNMDNQRLYQAIQQLTPRQQSLICRVYFQRCKYIEIAREEGRDPSSIRQATERAVKKIRKLLVTMD